MRGFAYIYCPLVLHMIMVTLYLGISFLNRDKAKGEYKKVIEIETNAKTRCFQNQD